LKSINIFGMGSSQSTTISNAYKQLTSITNTLFTQQITTSSASSWNSNVYKLAIENLEGCNVSSGQTITSSQTVKVNSEFSSKANLQNIVKQFIDSKSSSVQDAKNDFLATAVSLQKTNLSTSADLETFLNTSVSNIQETACLSISNNLNNGVVEIKNCKNSTITNVQDIYSQQMVDCTAKMITDTWLSNQDFKEIINKMEASQKSENAGLSSLLKWLIPVLIAIAVIIILVIVGKSVLSKKGGGEEMSGSMGGGRGGGGRGGGGRGRR